MLLKLNTDKFIQKIDNAFLPEEKGSAVIELIRNISLFTLNKDDVLTISDKLIDSLPKASNLVTKKIMLNWLTEKRNLCLLDEDQQAHIKQAVAPYQEIQKKLPELNTHRKF